MLHIMQARFCGMHLYIYITLKASIADFTPATRLLRAPRLAILHVFAAYRRAALPPCGRLEHKNSDLQAVHIELRNHGSAGHVTLFTALAITGRSGEFGLESVVWLTDQNGPDA